MRRLTIHLKEVEVFGKVIRNTLSFVVKSQKEINHHLGMHEGNVKKHYLSNINK